MAKPNLRLTKSLKEVHNVLRGLPLTTEVVLWVNVDEQRIHFKGKLLKVDFAANRIMLQLGTDKPSLETHNYVFIKWLNSEGVSKCRINTIKDNTLLVEVPEEIVMSENRRNWRAHFSEADAKKAIIHDGTSEHELLVLNISLNGLGLKIDQKIAKLLESGDKNLKIIKVGGTTLKNQDATITRQSNHLFGVELKEELPQEAFDQFISTNVAANVDPRKFFHDQEYYRVIKDNMATMVQKLEKMPKLAQAMKNLKVNRDGSYLREHTELLCLITSSIGKSLGWVTDNTIDKLIYVAYLHDIRYYDKPHLARIATLEEFNQKKAKLSEEDQKAFLEGPSYSALMAKDDESNSVDVERILLQQKERPDGSGFPGGLTFKQLVPLTCLFIICHDFVDYIISHRDWTFREFTVKARPVFKGPYFIKILAAFDDLGKSQSA